MSTQFGKVQFDGKAIVTADLEKIEALFAPCERDGHSAYANAGVGILYYPFHTTKESRRETQPYVFSEGVITWDGRLDNRTELIEQSDRALPRDSPDVSIVAAAYRRWGTNCFAKLVGDWAVSIWRPRDRSLLLAKDPIGTRHLYYCLGPAEVIWSTLLEALVFLRERPVSLEKEYLAGWLGFYPAAHLTPYTGIHSVPPSSFIQFEAIRQTPREYWTFDASKTITYRKDCDYEEHFRALFAQSVRRRLRSDAPVLAELSGGIDSSSIVCMADVLIARGDAETPKLDTLSYFNDAEPNWDERPFFSMVEEQRGREGSHVDARSLCTFEFGNRRFAETPSVGERSNDASRQFAACLLAGGNRVALSGMGGDETTGGVPDPTPELADLLARAQFRTLACQLKAWALAKRKPWLYLLSRVLRQFLPQAITGFPVDRRPPAWQDPRFAKMYRKAIGGYPATYRLFGPRPSFQENLSALNLLRRQLASLALPSDLPCEYRYPYLDRDLLEFLFAIPPSQLLRPGQRRSLLRRAMVGIVPQEILDRRRKAFLVRTPILAMSAAWAAFDGCDAILALIGIVDAARFREAITAAQYQEHSISRIVRTVELEGWLRHLEERELLPRRAAEHPRVTADSGSPWERPVDLPNP